MVNLAGIPGFRMGRLRRLREVMSPYCFPAQIREALSAKAPLPWNNGEHRGNDLIGFLWASLKKGEQTAYLITAPPGSGKTTLLIQLADKLTRRKIEFQYLHLGHPQAEVDLSRLCEAKDQLLLLDGLDESPAFLKDPERTLDLIFLAAENSRGLVLASSLPPGMPRPAPTPGHPGRVRWVGDTRYQVFQKFEIAPWDPSKIAAYKRFFRLSGRRWKDARELIEQDPWTFARPGAMKWMGLGNRALSFMRFSYQPVASYIQVWPHEESQLSELRGQLPGLAENWAMKTWENSAVSNTLWLDAETAGELCHPRRIQPDRLSGHFLGSDEQGNWAFAHQAFLSYFLAVRALRHEIALPKPGKYLPRLTDQFYLEMSWEQFLLTVEPEIVSVRLEGRKDPISAESITAQQLATITHLYLEKEPSPDAGLSFLDRFTQLTAVVLSGTERNKPPIEWLKFWPLPTEFHLAHSDGWHQVFEAGEEKEAWKQIVPGSKPDISLPLERPASVVDSPHSQRLLSSFPDDLRKLPKNICREDRTIQHADGRVTPKFICNLGYLIFDVFDQIQIFRLSDQQLNIRMTNSHYPSDPILLLGRVVEKLLGLYAEDDHGRGEFDAKDRVAILDNWWRGREWFWGKTDSYAYAMRIGMEFPGEIFLDIFGVENEAGL